MYKVLTVFNQGLRIVVRVRHAQLPEPVPVIKYVIDEREEKEWLDKYKQLTPAARNMEPQFVPIEKLLAGELLGIYIVFRQPESTTLTESVEQNAQDFDSADG